METRYKTIGEKDIRYMTELLGADRVFTEAEKLRKYGRDQTEDLHYLPAVAVFPETTEEVSSLMAYCNEQLIPVTPRGAGTGLSGGAIPYHGGLVLSFERMNKILEIDEKNYQIRTQPGVITQVLQEAVEERGLFYPVDPASRGSCFIGGNVAENSGGPRAVKYGVVQDYVLNLCLVLPSGKCIWTGANTLKNATGYNLTQLVVGSEGTLGVVTEIVLKLIPKPAKDVLLLAPFKSAEEACRTIAEIFHLGITPSALEFMERDALEIAMHYLGSGNTIEIEENTEAHLIIELDGKEEDDLMGDVEKIYELLESKGSENILFADSSQQKEVIWKLRRIVGEAVKHESIYKEEDTCVPRYALPDLLKEVKQLGREYGFRSVCYGHAGDGNLHINILKNGMGDSKWNTEIPEAIRRLFETVKAMNGILSGEHGIGLVQKPYMPIFFDESQLSLMLGIKKVFDPQMILNPGKIFPDQVKTEA